MLKFMPKIAPQQNSANQHWKVFGSWRDIPCWDGVFDIWDIVFKTWELHLHRV